MLSNNSQNSSSVTKH